MGFHYKKNIGKGFQMKHGNSAFKMFPDKTVEEIRSDNIELIPGLKEYEEYQANAPAFDSSNPISSYVNRVKYNFKSPANPLMNQGGGAMEFIGGRGAVKFLSRGFGKLFGKAATKKVLDNR